MSNTQLTVAMLAVLAAHVAALVAALLPKRGAGPLLVLNLAVAGVLLVLVASYPRLLDPVDWQLLGLAAFELVALAAAVAGLRRVGWAVPISCIVFGLHFLASAGAVAFALTFRITRLI